MRPGRAPRAAGSPGRTAASGERQGHGAGRWPLGTGQRGGQVPSREDGRGTVDAAQRCSWRHPRRALGGSRGQGRRPSAPQWEGQRGTQGCQVGCPGSMGLCT